MSQPPTVELYQGRPAARAASPAASIAIDTETMGLNPYRDRLCLVQLSEGDGSAVLVQFAGNYDAPELKRLLADESVLKIFHFGRFDMAVLKHYFGVMPRPVYCTKVASQARPHLHRPPRPQGSVQGAARHRAVQAAAILRLGGGRADPGAAQLCRERRVASARAKGETRRHAEARRARRAGPRLLRVSADPGRARPQGLVRDRSFRPLAAEKGAPGLGSRSQCHQSPAASWCRPA